MRTPIPEGPSPGTGLRHRHAQARTLGDFIAGAEANLEFWRGMHARPAPRELVEIAVRLSRPHHLPVLLEDWCWDAVNSITVLDRVAAEVPLLDLGVLERDRHLDLMDQYLTKGARAIPIALILDGEFGVVGHWGPRPAAPQSWFEEQRDRLPTMELYRGLRLWYVRDAGRSVVEEILAVTRSSPQHRAA